MKLLVVFGALVSTLAMAIPRDIDNEHYVSVPYKGRESIKRLVDAGFEVGGINLEKKTISLIVKERDLKSTRGLKVIDMRPVGSFSAICCKPPTVFEYE